MSATATPTLRWSTVRDCPRRAVYEATGEPEREWYDRERRIVYRGKSIGRDYTIFLASTRGLLIDVASGPDYWVPPELRLDALATQPADYLIAEKAYRWPLGTLHVDIVEAQAEKAIEVLSSAHASDQMIRSKLLQLVGQMEYGDLKSGALVIVNPSDFTEDVLPVARSSRTYSDLVDEMQARVQQVQAWAEQGTLPVRVCSKPSDARSHFCRHADHCFDGWDAPELPLLEDADAVMLAARLDELKTQERDAKAPVKQLEAERKEVEAELAERVPAGKHQVGGYALTRTDVHRSATVDLRKAELAGYPVESLEPYMKEGASYSTWKVERLTVDTEDFGDVPFHGDERDAA